MKANELRIGNLVYGLNNKNYSEKKVAIISTIYQYGWKTVGAKNGIAPIPLTEEWLIRLGFEIMQDGWYSFEKNPVSFTWNIYDKEVRAMGYRFGHIKYIHQLQNFYFALTGEELTIKP